MEPLKKIKEYLLILLIVILMFIVFKQGLFSPQPKENENIRVDTIYTTIEIPAKEGTFVNKKPKPIYISDTTKDQYIAFLELKMNSLYTQTEKQEYLLKQLSKKAYMKVYSDTTVSITVTDSVNGFLQYQDVKWNVKPQSIIVKEIYTTKKLKPRFTMSAGGGLESGFPKLNPVFKGVLGFKNRNGYELLPGYSTDNRYSIILKKDIFTIY